MLRELGPDPSAGGSSERGCTSTNQDAPPSIEYHTLEPTAYTKRAAPWLRPAATYQTLSLPPATATSFHVRPPSELNAIEAPPAAYMSAGLSGATARQLAICTTPPRSNWCTRVHVMPPF